MINNITKTLKLKQLPGPEITIKEWTQAAPFASYSGLPLAARILLTVASNFATHHGNLYKQCSNNTIENMLGFSHSLLMRCKRQLRDKGFLDYQGNLGNLQPIIDEWEKQHNRKWEYRLK